MTDKLIKCFKAADDGDILIDNLRKELRKRKDDYEREDHDRTGDTGQKRCAGNGGQDRLEEGANGERRGEINFTRIVTVQVEQTPRRRRQHGQ